MANTCYGATDKLIHRLWLGHTPMPEEYVAYGQRWRELNPEYKVIDWKWQWIDETSWHCEDILDDLTRRDDYKGSVEWAVQTADVIGYELVYKYGGVYVNCDIEPVRPLSHTGLDDDTAWATREDDYWIVNAVLGGPAGHPFWRAVLDELPKRYWRMRNQPMHKVTGPHLLTAVAATRSDLTVLPKETFNPVHYSSVALGGDATGLYDWQADDRVIGVHHWGHRKSGRGHKVGK